MTNRKTEEEIWDKNIKPRNRWLLLKQLKWWLLGPLGIRTLKEKKIVTMGDEDRLFEDNVKEIARIFVWVVSLLAIVIALQIVGEVVTLIYPNYFGST